MDGTATVPSFPGNATARGVARSTLTQNPKHDQDQNAANEEKTIVAYTSGPNTGRLVKCWPSTGRLAQYQHSFQVYGTQPVGGPFGSRMSDVFTLQSRAVAEVQSQSDSEIILWLGSS